MIRIAAHHRLQVTAGLMLFAWSLAMAPLGGVAGDPPNVVLIMADDLGYGDLSCHGSERIRTPHLDQLAADGVRLTDFYTGSTVCTPSRMALLTGCYPTRLGWPGGVVGYKIPGQNGLAPQAITLAEIFKDAGYATALIGKWHLGDVAELQPMRQGFDTTFYIKKSNNQTKQLWRGETLVADPFDNSRLSEQFAAEAIRFIRENRDRPFLLYLPFTAPHFPAEAHPDWDGRSANGAYGDVVEELDHRIGEIRGALAEERLDRRTLVVFLSDNGPEPGQKAFASGAPFRGLKWSSLEGGTRVPCLAAWPGVIPAGQVRDELVAAVDLLPTLARACGIELPESQPALDGVDVWDTLRDELSSAEGRTHPRDELLYWSGWAEPQAIRVGSWKLYFDEVKDVPDTKTGPVLFDLAADPAEQNNLAADHPERVSSMLARARTRLQKITAAAIDLGGPPLAREPADTPRWLE